MHQKNSNILNPLGLSKEMMVPNEEILKKSGEGIVNNQKSLFHNENREIELEGVVRLGSSVPPLPLS